MANGALLSSKIVSQEEEPRLRAIPNVQTAVILAIGTTEKGPIGVPTLCQSWEDYRKVFGGFTVDSEIALSVYGTYRNDPSAWVYVVRTCHYTISGGGLVWTADALQAEVDLDGTSGAASQGAETGSIAGPWALTPGDTLDVRIDGGGAGVATFAATQAVLTGGAPAIAAMTGKTVIFTVDGGAVQTVTFTAAAVSVATALNELNDQSVGCKWIDDGGGNIDAASDLYGSNSEIDITGGTGLAEIGHSIATSPGTGDPVADISAVTGAEAKALIEAAVANPCTVTTETTGELTITSDKAGGGPTSIVQVDAGSSADDEFGFDNAAHAGTATTTVPVLTIKGKYPGTYSESLTPEIVEASNGEATYFNMLVKDSEGVALEVWPNMQLADDTAADFVEAIINHATQGSIYFEAEDLGIGTRPDDTTTATLAGGDDGLSGLVDDDFVGDEAAQTGLHAFDTILDGTILIVPGRTGATMQTGMVDWTNLYRAGKVFPILDPLTGTTAADMKTYMTSSALKGLSEAGAMYWPEINVLNPSKAVFGTDEEITVAPSGWCAGVYSRVDNSREGGIYDPPAGVRKSARVARGRIIGAVGLADENVLREEVRDLIYPERINPITTLPGYPIFLDGVYTLQGDGNFPTIAERRGVSHIETQIENALQFARHSNNDEDLRADSFRTVYAYLVAQMKLGAFRSKNPATAFWVDFSEALNTPSVIAALKLLGRIGLATQKPAEFIVLSFSQDTRAIEEELLG
jgi:Bacteriophage tail sheath protein